MFECEGVRRRAVLFQVTESLFGLFDGRFVGGGDPPADEVRLLVQIEELATTAVDGGVVGFVGVVEESVGGLPDAEVDNDGLVVRDRDGKLQTLPANTVAIARPLQANIKLADSLKGAAPEFYVIGDCKEPGLMAEAIADGAIIGNTI